MSAEESRQSMPFEPAGNKKQRKSAGKKGTPIIKSQTLEADLEEKGSGYIPEVVSKRMIRRAVVCCGVPVLLGMSDFILGYFAIINHWFPVSNTVVLLTSMAFLGLSVLGLSYGILSACWEEDSNIKGSLLGWTECKTNFGRMVQAYRASQRVRAKIDPNL